MSKNNRHRKNAFDIVSLLRFFFFLSHSKLVSNSNWDFYNTNFIRTYIYISKWNRQRCFKNLFYLNLAFERKPWVYQDVDGILYAYLSSINLRDFFSSECFKFVWTLINAIDNDKKLLLSENVVNQKIRRKIPSKNSVYSASNL